MGAEGIEPPHAALEAASLPLAYAPNIYPRKLQFLIVFIHLFYLINLIVRN